VRALRQVSEVKLIAYDKQTLRQLNAASTQSCGATSWQYGAAQVVTNTSGCPVIDVVVAGFETDIVRVDDRYHSPLLYLGRIGYCVLCTFLSSSIQCCIHLQTRNTINFF